MFNYPGFAKKNVKKRPPHYDAQRKLISGIIIQMFGKKKTATTRILLEMRHLLMAEIADILVIPKYLTYLSNWYAYTI